MEKLYSIEEINEIVVRKEVESRVLLEDEIRITENLQTALLISHVKTMPIEKQHRKMSILKDIMHGQVIVEFKPDLSYDEDDDVLNDSLCQVLRDESMEAFVIGKCWMKGKSGYSNVKDCYYDSKRCNTDLMTLCEAGNYFPDPNDFVEYYKEHQTNSHYGDWDSQSIATFKGRLYFTWCPDVFNAIASSNHHHEAFHKFFVKIGWIKLA